MAHITIKSQEEIVKLKKGGQILASILRELENFTQKNYKKSDFNTLSIEKKCQELMQIRSVRPAFPTASFPAAICVSVNEEVVHGVPGDRKLKEGDLVSLDLGVIYEELFTDAAISFILGRGSKLDEMLKNAAREALYAGIKEIKEGKKIGDISAAIEKSISSHGFGIVRNYCGHGVGYSVHEPPQIPNYGKSGAGEILKEGMVLAIEPMLVLGSEDVGVDKNGWTVKTCDGKKSAHWEHTVAVRKKGALVLTE